VTPVTIGWGCCVGTWSKFEENSKSWGPGPVFHRTDQRSISVAYNSLLDEFLELDVNFVVLVHDDLEVTDPRAAWKVLEAMADGATVVGVCGGGPSMSWWDHDPIGHQTTDSLHLEFGGRRTGDVDVVEGSFLAFSPWAVANLRFDERFEFLGYDDVCLMARAAGKRVVVADIDTHHHTTVGFKSDAVREMWHESERLWVEKWGHA
jgi:hypothetical protein